MLNSIACTFSKIVCHGLCSEVLPTATSAKLSAWPISRTSSGVTVLWPPTAPPARLCIKFSVATSTNSNDALFVARRTIQWVLSSDFLLRPSSNFWTTFEFYQCFCTVVLNITSDWQWGHFQVESFWQDFKFNANFYVNRGYHAVGFPSSSYNKWILPNTLRQWASSSTSNFSIKLLNTSFIKQLFGGCVKSLNVLISVTERVVIPNSHSVLSAFCKF